MNTSTHNEPMPRKKIADEFASWPMSDAGVNAAAEIRQKFDELLDTIVMRTPTHNGHYLALVKTKLEEACMFAVKGVAKPIS